MNPLNEILSKAASRFPDLKSEMLEPVSSQGRWILELHLEDWTVIVGWVPNRREIGISTLSTEEEGDYGTGFDETFPESDLTAACERVLDLLAHKKSTKPPLSVVLKDLRLRLGITQEEVAEKLGVRQSSVSKMESRPDIAVSALAKLINALGGVLEIWVRFPHEPAHKISQFEEQPAKKGA